VINGSHAILYSTNPDADRAFLRDVLGLPHVDVGRGWLIFGLPPSEIAVHPAEEGGSHELYLMCADIERFKAAVAARGIAVGDISNQPWGHVVTLTLPGGGTVGVYEPRHARPPAPAAGGLDRDQCVAAYTTLLQAWNERNANRFAGLFTADATVIGFDGSTMNGPSDIVSQMRSIFAAHSTATYVAIVKEVAAAGPGVVLLRAAAGMVPPGGGPLIDKRNTWQSVVIVADGGLAKVKLFQNTPAAFHERPDLAERMTGELSAVARGGRVVQDR
jgi:uncharacterized protein (TIGR02246 family)